MATGVPGPWVRRPISIGLLVVLSVVGSILLPFLVVLGLFIDVATRRWHLPKMRTPILIMLLILADLAGCILVAAVWVLSPVGTRTRAPTDQRRYQWVMTWWTTALMKVISLSIPVPLDLTELDESLLGGNAIVIGRHRSLLDAVLPAVVFGKLGTRTLYTLKEDLRWEPNIDIVGHRMGHRFITRAPQDLEAELEPIRKLAGRLDDETVAVIFPEGTFFTAERKDRVVASLERRDPDRADAARRMRFVLPPRPAGTLALLDGAPGADVILFGHVGFEPFGSIKQILSNMGAVHSVRLRAWRFPRNEIPDDDVGRIEWLFDRWAELDEWVASKHPLAGHGDP